MIFKDPWILLLLPVIVVLVHFIRRRQKNPSIVYPAIGFFKDLPVSYKAQFSFLPYVLRLTALGLFVIALAGPRSVLEETVHKTEGIDIVLTIDASGSMAGEDFQEGGKRLNRLAIVKHVVKDFIEARPSDRIGLVTFAGVAYTVCPLTTDYNWLKANLERIDLGQIQDGTAIGSAIASSLVRLKNSDAKSKVIILLTDGVNNAGKIDPLEAAKAAAALGIKIYSIGAGTKGYVPFPASDFFGRKVYQNVLIDIDDAMLGEVARLTNGKYFRATDTESLKAVYKEIDTLEKTKIEQSGYKEYKELFRYFLIVALGILLVELILSSTIFMRAP